MTEHPIIFSGEMARAILDGRKTMTRRVVKLPARLAKIPFPPDHYTIFNRPWGAEMVCWPGDNAEVYPLRCPYGAAGDMLWVRETWTIDPNDYGYPEEERRHFVGYRADVHDLLPTHWGWHPSIFMPRWASRLTLRNELVRIERVQDITEADAAAEGFISRAEFLAYWDVLNTTRGYPASQNDWVWVVTFARAE